MTRKIMPLLLLCVAVSLHAQDRNHRGSDDFPFCSCFEDIQEQYRADLDIHISVPDDFKADCGYGACYSYYIPTGQEYVAVLTSKDKNCKVLIPAIRKESKVSAKTHIQEDFANAKDCYKHVTKITGLHPRQHFNADTIYSYSIPTDAFLDDRGNNGRDVKPLNKYPKIEKLILFKDGQKAFPLVFLFTEKGYANKEKYIKAFDFHIYFIKKESLYQLWGLSS